MSDELRRITDHRAIQDTVLRYFRAYDALDWPSVEACLTEDVQAYLNDAPIPRGRAALIDRIDLMSHPELRERMGIGEISLWTHFVGGVFVQLHGDSAEVETSVLSFMVHSKDGVEHLRMRHLRYLDRLVRTSDGWKIAIRHHTADWTNADGVIGSKDFATRTRARALDAHES